MSQLSNEAIQARREYQRNYYRNIPEGRKQARKDYLKAWRKNNPEKVAAITARYWNKKAQQAQTED